MEKAIKSGFDLNSYNRVGITPLIEAIDCNLIKIVEMFLENGADPNFASLDGEYPLMTAIMTKRDLMIEKLIEKKANPTNRDSNGKTAMHLIVEKDRPVKLLCLAFINGCSLKDEDCEGKTPEDYCISEEMRDTIMKLKHNREAILKKELQLTTAFVRRFVSHTSFKDNISASVFSELHSDSLEVSRDEIPQNNMLLTINEVDRAHDCSKANDNSGAYEEPCRRLRNRDSSFQKTLSPFSIASYKASSKKEEEVSVLNMREDLTGISSNFNPRIKLDFNSRYPDDESLSVSQVQEMQEEKESEVNVEKIIKLMNWMDELKVPNKTTTKFIERKVFDVPKFVREIKEEERVKVLKRMEIGEVGIIYRILAKVEIEESPDRTEMFYKLMSFFDELPSGMNGKSLRFSLNEVNDCCMFGVNGKKKVKTLIGWLQRLNLESYVLNFEANGFDRLAFLYASFLSRNFKFTESVLLKSCHIYDEKARKKIAETLFEDFTAFQKGNLEKFYVSEKNDGCAIF